MMTNSLIHKKWISDWDSKLFFIDIVILKETAWLNSTGKIGDWTLDTIIMKRLKLNNKMMIKKINLT